MDIVKGYSKIIGEVDFKNYVNNWLKEYTNEVIHRVLKNIKEIRDSDFACWMLKELYIREEKSLTNFKFIMNVMIDEYTKKGKADNNPRLNVLEHPQSYRDVLYDMYIRKEGD